MVGRIFENFNWLVFPISNPIEDNETADLIRKLNVLEKNEECLIRVFASNLYQKV